MGDPSSRNPAIVAVPEAPDLGLFGMGIGQRLAIALATVAVLAAATWWALAA